MGLGSIDVSGAQDPRGRKVRFRAGERIYQRVAAFTPCPVRHEFLPPPLHCELVAAKQHVPFVPPRSIAHT